MPAKKRRKRGQPKGRQVKLAALTEVRSLLGKHPRRHDLLLEHLHKIQDCGGHLSSDHLTALAREMKLSTSGI